MSVKSKGQNISFLKVAMLHIKLKGMKRRTPYMQIVYPYKHPRLLGCVERSNIVF